jgi:cell division protein FtsQ
MTPSNRRVKKPQLPPDVLEASGIAEGEDLVEPQPAPPPAPKKRTRFGIAVRAVLGVALVVGISSTVAWGARRHMMTSARFAVKEIEVTGMKHRTPEEVMAKSGIARGNNVFGTDLDVAKAKLLSDPWIADAQLARRLPATIVIQVTEREAAAVVSVGELFLASRDGDLFKRVEPGDPVELPVVTGITAENVAEDREGVKRLVRRAIDLSADYDHSPLAGRLPLQEIHYSEGRGITMIVGRAGLRLVVGEPPFRKKLEQAARVISEVEKRGGKADAVMLDNEARPERVVVRMR